MSLLSEVIQHQFADLLAGGVAPPIARSAEPLIAQLESGEFLPRGIDLDLSSFLSAVPSAGALAADLDGALSRLRSRIGLVLHAGSVGDLQAALGALLDPRDGEKVAASVTRFFGTQTSLAIGLLTTLARLQDPRRVAQAVAAGMQQYFFTPDGFRTADGDDLAAPGASDRRAERYIRDALRVLVEVAGDLQYGTRARVDRMRAALDDTPERSGRAMAWLRGFAAMGESSVTGAVEEACLGVAQVQTNAVIGAAAGTFAGVVARKAIQHVILGELGF